MALMDKAIWMSIISNSTLFFIIAIIYAFFIVCDFYQNNKQLTLKAKTWLFIVFVFLSVSLWL